MCVFKIQIKEHLNQPVEKILEQKLAVGQNFLSKNKSIEEEKKGVLVKLHWPCQGQQH
jgi:hypothetical protein